MYKWFIEDDQTIDDYLDWLMDDSTWGSQLEMKALAEVLNFNVQVYQSDSPCVF